MYSIFFLCGRTHLSQGALPTCLAMLNEPTVKMIQDVRDATGFCWLAYKSEVDIDPLTIHPDDICAGCKNAIDQYLAHEAEKHPFKGAPTPLDAITAMLDGTMEAPPAHGAGADLLDAIDEAGWKKKAKRRERRANQGLRLYNPHRN